MDPPPRYLSPETAEELVLGVTILMIFSEDYFEVYNISLDQNLTI